MQTGAMPREEYEEQNDRWCVIADADAVGSWLPCSLQRFGRDLVLWRDSTGELVGQLARESEDPREPPPSIIVREAHGWIWWWRGDERSMLPRIAYFEGVRPDEHLSLVSQTWACSYEHAVEQARGSRPATDELAPNLWESALNEHMGIVVAVIPVDHEHTEVLVRSYQRVVNLEGISHLFSSAIRLRASQHMAGPAPAGSASSAGEHAEPAATASLGW